MSLSTGWQDWSLRDKLKFRDKLRERVTALDPVAHLLPEEVRARLRFDSVGYIREKLGWTPWKGSGPQEPGQVEILAAYNLALRQMHEKDDWEQGLIGDDDLVYWQPGQTIKNVIRVEAGHTVGKTKLGSGIVNHFLDCFAHSLVYTYAPSWESVRDLLWKEIRVDREGKGLPGRILETCEIKITADHFAKGKATNDAGGRGTERVQGNHGKYLLFIIDEAEGVDDFVYNAIESMRSGGIVIVVMFANPRTRTSRFHKYASLSYVCSFRISCVNHPNVKAGRDVVPNAVKRDYVASMVEKHCDPVPRHDHDENTFAVPFPVAKNGMVFPAGQIWQPDSECCFRVLGIAPANNANNTLIPVGRFEAATKRLPTSDQPERAWMGVDVARFGQDFGTLYTRHDGVVWRSSQLTKQDTTEYKRQIVEVAEGLALRGVRRLDIRVDGTGIGGGVIDQLRRDTALRELFERVAIVEAHNGGTPYDPKKYKNLGTEMYAEAGEALHGLVVTNPPEALEADLCERTFDWVSVKERAVKVLSDKDGFRRKHHRSPDDGDGFCLCVAPDHIFRPKDEKALPLVPSQLIIAASRKSDSPKQADERRAYDTQRRRRQ